MVQGLCITEGLAMLRQGSELCTVFLIRPQFSVHFVRTDLLFDADRCHHSCRPNLAFVGWVRKLSGG